MSALETLVTPLGWLLRGKRAGEQFSVRHAAELAAPVGIRISSPAFDHGGTIPDRHCSGSRGDNLSPALHWDGIPDGTQQLLLIIEDIDSPTKRPSVHTTALFSPANARLEEG